MLRIIVPIAMLLTCFGCDATRIEKRTESGNVTPSKDEVAASEINSKWKSFAKNEWYELSELRVNDNQSIIKWRIAKPDAQLGIAVAIDLGVLAQPRGFTHFRRLKMNPTETYANLLNNIEINEDQGDELFVVEFYTAEPVDTDQVFDVKSMVQLANQRDLNAQTDTQSLPKRYLPFQGEWQIVSMEGAVTKELIKPEIFVSVTGQRFEFSGSSFKDSRGPFEFQIPETDIDSPFRELQKHGAEDLDDIIDVQNQIMVFWYVGIFELTDDKLHLALKYCGQGVEGERFKTFRPPSSFDEKLMEGEIRIVLERKKK